MKRVTSLLGVLVVLAGFTAAAYEEQKSSKERKSEACGECNKGGDEPVVDFPCACPLMHHADGTIAIPYVKATGCYVPGDAIWLSELYNCPEYCDNGDENQECDCSVPVALDSAPPPPLFSAPLASDAEPWDVVHARHNQVTRRTSSLYHVRMVDERGNEVAKFAVSQLAFDPGELHNDESMPLEVLWLGVEISSFPENANPLTIELDTDGKFLGNEYRPVRDRRNTRDVQGQFHARLKVRGSPTALLLRAERDGWF